MSFNSSAFSVSLVGFIFSVFVILLNLRLLFKFSFTSLRNKHEYELFTIRFIVDVVFSIFVSVYYIGLCFSYVEYFVLFDYKPLFVDALIVSNIYTARFLLAFFIAVERLTAVFFPIKFHLYRQRFSPILIVACLVIYGCFEDVMYFFICKVEPFEKVCSIMACTWNSCFVRYWTGNKIIIGAFSCTVSLALFVKIMFLKRNAMNSDLKKTIHLCLIDALMTIVFDLCPYYLTLFSYNFMLSSDVFGPYNGTLKSISCFVDALIASFILKQGSTTIVRENPKTSRFSGRDNSEIRA